MKARKPIVAGKFYHSDPDKLREQIRSCYTHELGPGLPDRKKQFSYLEGVIVPHAGYDFSGMCAAHAYKEIAESKPFDLFVMIGFNHSGHDFRSPATAKIPWATPFGNVEVDSRLVDLLVSSTSVIDNSMPHENEHSIEVQLPFLQDACDYPFKILPLSIPHGIDFEKEAKEIEEVLKSYGKRICYICSSDFTHFGPHYDFTPFRKNIKENIEKLDKGAIEKIKVVHSNQFLEYVEYKDATICGKYAIAFMIEIMQDQVNRIELAKYYTSGDIVDDYTNSVSYAAIIFENVRL